MSSVMFAEWTILPEGTGGVRPGEVAPVRRIELSPDRLGAVAQAGGRVLGDICGPVSGIATVCPDPLVFALEAGLPRLTADGSWIDGGSRWCDLAPIGGEFLHAVSSVNEVGSRITSDGRTLVRVVYRTHFTDLTGVPVGTADGTSLHVRNAR